MSFETLMQQNMLSSTPLNCLDLEAWDTVITDVCGHFHTKSHRKEIHGNIDVLKQGNVDLAFVNHDSDIISKSYKDIAKDDCSHYFLIIQLAGQSSLQQNKSTANLNNFGDMALIDSTKPSEFSFTGTGSSQLSIHLPRNLMQNSKFSQFRCAEVIDGNSHVAHLIRDYITIMMKKPLNTKNDRVNINLSNSLLELIKGYFVHEDTNFALVDECTKIDRIINFIHMNASNNDFSIDYLCHQLGISKRTLFRIFQEYDISCNLIIANTRLEYFTNSLHQCILNDLPINITTLAYQSGFNDLSTFNRAVKKKFDLTPSAYIEKLKQELI